MGAERLVALYEECGGEAGNSAPDVYVVAAGDGAFAVGMKLAEQLRDVIAGLKVELNLGGGSFKSQLKRADKSGAAYAVILGEDEVARNEAGLKPLRTGEDQTSVALDELANALAERLKG
jgi:histidyl-tRNA synthetase